MSLIVVVMMVVGMILVYSAVKNKDPRQVVKEALKRG